MQEKNIPPHDGVQRYLNDRKPELSQKSLYNYRISVNQFADWCTDQNIRYLRELDGDLIAQFKDYRLEQVATITARNDMRVIKNFIEFCESIHAVFSGLAELVRIPKTTEQDEICDDFLTKEEADAILEFLGKHQYASHRHVILLLLWKTGARISGLRTLDVDDIDSTGPTVQIRHRPDTGTPLKNDERGERNVFVTEETMEVIQDFIEHQRPNTTDEYDRKPLIATRHGRAAHTTIQRHVYSATRPCNYNGGNCPWDKRPETCEANTWDGASKCEGSVSPHALRRGYVTAARNAGQPKDVTGERVNMSGRVLDKHYDKGNHQEKANRRQDHLRDI
ncbi:site-specific integrase [Halogeometricum sp. S1BR25-6]|uniref:Site-specific integrase n=1 Tax=Halogeometricum salsisoli TaxID=2950536 RepID=A0ABU2GBQ1_9EURY|nr:tyrosine-type recombinase/integrase [Halogeometricum sp. S1BR25-6]MDS0298232.1 site-specific integrase [Halogeometricum sp. S1BR25-6]